MHVTASIRRARATSTSIKGGYRIEVAWPGTSHHVINLRGCRMRKSIRIRYSTSSQQEASTPLCNATYFYLSDLKRMACVCLHVCTSMPPEILPEKTPPAIKPNGNCPNGIFLKRSLTCRYISDGKNLTDFCPTGNPPRPIRGYHQCPLGKQRAES